MGNLFKVPTTILEAHFSIRFHTTPLSICHQRLGYPHVTTVSCLNNNGFIEVLSKNNDLSICDSCQMCNEYITSL